MNLWTRPKSVPYPSVWLRFGAKDPETGEKTEYRVQDLPETRFEEAIEFMSADYLEDEPWCGTFNLKKDPVSLVEYQTLWRKSLHQKVVLVCFKAGSDEIVGINMLGVSMREDKEKNCELRGDAWSLLWRMMGFIVGHYDVLDSLGLDAYLTAYGLNVARKYRRLGIAEQILRARVPLMKAVGLRHTATVFSVQGSQRAAEKAGFQTHFEISYEDLAKRGFVLPGAREKCVKYMGMSA